jgi:ribosome biogenesis GTPase / thiamine phosphate phosphatase
MRDMGATVIATYSRRARVRFADGTEAEARIKGKTLRPVCGDTVATRPIEGEDDCLIEEIGPRRNALTRPNARGATEVLAANVDVLVVVAAASPMPDWFIVDRYLCAAEIMGATGVLVYNKTDEVEAPSTPAELEVFRSIAYPVYRTCAKFDVALAGLAQNIGTRTAIFVGQSGVGKSSLVNLLSHPSRQKTSSISSKTGEGRHTTVTSLMLPLSSGGYVIDSPGVRDFAPVFDSAADVEYGYREVHASGGACRFANCQHLREPGCKVKAAVENGVIAARRYESYRRSLRHFERLRTR